MNQAKPKLPYYLRPSKRLKSLDEFEPPEWKGRMKLGEERGTLRGLTRDTSSWVKIFVFAALLGGALGWWLAQPDRCANIIGGFKVGWC